MAKAIDTLKIALDFQDKGSQAVIERIAGSLKKLQQAASGARPNIKGLRDAILAQGNASVKSVSNINAQRTALAGLRDEVKIGGQAFKQLTADIQKLDAQMGKSKSTRGPGARGATQIAGAVISGGIFGGPEGALGAIGGAAVGGVEGAFAGAAAGAVLGGIRQSIGETASYAASIDKLKIALEGVAPSTADFNSALATAAQATRELNVPQEVAISGITRLTAAVVGAEGPVTDAETVFKNVTAAIKATGGNAEDVKGAITAMVQVFSKGKVSAEELSGQLGERLPGAVTLFAKANNMSLQELQENLKKGTVGLNELMAFVRQLGVEYGGTAAEISSSGAEAGARLTVAVNNLRLAVGDAMKDVGAGFQEGFTEFIVEITPTAVALAQQLSDALKVLGKVVEVVVKNFDVLGVSIAGAGIGALIAAVVKAGVVVKALTFAVGALNIAMLANPIFLAAMGGAIALGGIYALTQAISGQADEVERLNRANALATRVENTAYSQGSQEVAADLAEARREKGAAGIELAQLNKRIRGLRDTVSKLSIAEDSIERHQLREALVKRGRLYDTIQKSDKTISKLGPLLPTAKELGVEESPYPTLVPEGPGGGGGGGGTKVKDITEAVLKASLAELAARSKIVKLDDESVRLRREQFVAQRDTAIEAAKAKNAATGGLKPRQESLDIAKAEQKFEQQNLQLNRLIEADAQRKLDLDKERATALREVQLITGEITQEQFDQQEAIARAAELTELLPDHYEKVKEALEQAATPLGRFKEGLKEVFESALNLNDALATRGVEAVQQFGDAFADFVATGKTSFAELTQSILQDLARIFARAALFQALSFIPGVGNFLGLGGGGGGSGFNTAGSIHVAAKGGIYAKNKIVPFAYGGIVKKPMLFPMANGAGLMGEAGPEAIMPLRRGRDGRLGVEASGGIGNVVVNVDASGSSVQGDQPNAKALGSAIGIAVQAELVRQKRPGGLLS